MKPAEIIKRLEKAKQIMEALPEDAKVLGVSISGIKCLSKNDNIQIATPFERLAEADVISPKAWASTNRPGLDGSGIVEDSILTGGFRLFHLRKKGTS